MILCVGEILADFIGISENGVMRYNRYAGGAPFNVACGIKKQNGSVGFLGSVGDDIIGSFLISFAKSQEFDKLIINKNEKRNTTLAFVELSKNGERSFSFLRKHSADYHISRDDFLNSSSDADIIHMGSLMLSEECGIEFADFLFSYGKENGKLISFDVNFRDDIFKNRSTAVEIYKKYVQFSDILKLSEDELEIFEPYLTNENQLVFITLGSKGSILRYKNKEYICESISVTPVDTLGAGDAFFAGVLSCISEFDIYNLSESEIMYTLKYGNILGALTTTKYGAIDACPKKDEVIKILG